MIHFFLVGVIKTSIFVDVDIGGVCKQIEAIDPISGNVYLVVRLLKPKVYNRVYLRSRHKRSRRAEPDGIVFSILDERYRRDIGIRHAHEICIGYYNVHRLIPFCRCYQFRRT